MNKIYIFFGLFLLTSCSPSDIPPEGLEERQGVYYEVNSQIPYSGPIEVYHENGQLRFKGNYKDGKREGPFESYHDNGQLDIKVNFKDDKQEGPEVGYSDNGKLCSEGNYKEGKPDGFFEFYCPKGREYYKDGEGTVLLFLKPDRIVERNGITYEVNKTTPFYGTIRYYHENILNDLTSAFGGEKEKPRIRVEKTFINGQLEGPHRYYFFDGKLSRKENYKDGKEDGLAESYFQNGRLSYFTNYKDGKKDGLEHLYFKNGQLKEEGNYKDGKLNGPYEKYYINGQLKEEGNYQYGSQFGPYKKYYKNGQLEERGNWKDFKDGKREGLLESYYESGQLKEKGNYKDGKLDGIHEIFYENNQNRFSGKYVNGKEEGEHKSFSESGVLWKKNSFKNGLKNGLSFQDCRNLWFSCERKENNFKNGQKHGFQLEEIYKVTSANYEFYKDGMKHGTWEIRGRDSANNHFYRTPDWSQDVALLEKIYYFNDKKICSQKYGGVSKGETGNKRNPFRYVYEIVKDSCVRVDKSLIIETKYPSW
jgi:antitoxin component YwqK of YwqJK toxin-antitoxin module